MTEGPISTVIGVFPDHDQADRAIDELRRNQFTYDRIRLVEHGTGSFFDNLRGMFTGQASVASNTADDLKKMGMPEYEAHHYQQELEAHHVLLLMNADDKPEEAFRIMRQMGAFDINSRLRTAPSNAPAEATYPNGSQETYHADRPMTTARPTVPPSVSQDDRPMTTTSPDVSPPASRTNMPPEVSSPDIPPATSNADETRETSRNA